MQGVRVLPAQRQSKSASPAAQLELFPGFDPRQLPLYPGTRWATSIEPNRRGLSEDEALRLESIAGPEQEPFYSAERGL